MANKFKKGDIVLIITGKDKGKEGAILEVIPKKKKVIVEGLNIVSKHKKRTKDENGGIVKLPAPLDWSNVKLKDPVSKEPIRVGFETTKDGIKKRKSKKSGELF